MLSQNPSYLIYFAHSWKSKEMLIYIFLFIFIYDIWFIFIYDMWYLYMNKNV